MLKTNSIAACFALFALTIVCSCNNSNKNPDNQASDRDFTEPYYTITRWVDKGEKCFYKNQDIDHYFSFSNLYLEGKMLSLEITVNLYDNFSIYSSFEEYNDFLSAPDLDSKWSSVLVTGLRNVNYRIFGNVSLSDTAKQPIEYISKDVTTTCYVTIDLSNPIFTKNIEDSNVAKDIINPMFFLKDGASDMDYKVLFLNIRGDCPELFDYIKKM